MDDYIKQVQGQCGVLVVRGTPDAPQVATGGGRTLTLPGNSAGRRAIGARCSAGQVIVGFGGRGGLYLDQVQIFCAPLTLARSGAGWSVGVGAARSAGSMGGSGGSAFARSSCPSGQVATGLTYRSGDWVDGIGLTCGTPRAEP